MSFQKIRKLLKKFFRAFLSFKSCSMNLSKIGRPQLIRSSIPVDYTPGEVYDLEKIYQDLNLRLFEGSLNLKIGW
ncbi:hypothetical protein CP8484711_0339A, partial [Chlamydia psittaci 84-8471/1]